MYGEGETSVRFSGISEFSSGEPCSYRELFPFQRNMICPLFIYFFVLCRLFIGIKKLLVLIEMARQVMYTHILARIMDYCLGKEHKKGIQ